jgi:hypothetical protein
MRCDEMQWVILVIVYVHGEQSLSILENSHSRLLLTLRTFIADSVGDTQSQAGYSCPSYQHGRNI